MWVDATIAASFITDPKQSKVADKVAFAQAPSQVTSKGANWLWAWALAVPASTKNARRGAEVRQLGDVQGVHPARGARKRAGRTCRPARASRPTRTPEFQKAAVFAAAEKAAIDSANPLDSTLPKSPYTGVQFATIPEFQSIGVTVGQQMSAALAGKETVDAALKASQVAADREMKKAGYYK